MFLMFLIALEIGSPSFAAKPWDIYATSRTRDASWEAEKWNEKAWSLACLWSLAGKICCHIQPLANKI